ncbi:hypothetical protein C0Q70_03322 [Pomacea canaliculata]|uniref:Methyltransferase domain-containing protein n=1 Tax=Pomacea canaliculata TaxID=400727 RepID=A0A2T7PSE4_POMCA|nr:hypothetical protein C0Q70_03322 [Pomacea canaliculata]
MPRAYRRPYLFIIGMTVFFLLIYILLYTDLSGSRLSSSPQENLDLKLSPDLLGLGVLQQPHGPGVVAGLSSKRIRGMPPFIPQLHIKTLPHPVVTSNMTETEAEENFFRYLENKDVLCKNDVRLGHQHEGGWNVCLSPPFSLLHPCVVMSFGIGRDWQFDEAVSKIYGCRVLAYDPSILKIGDKQSKLIEFKRIGIGRRNEVNTAGWQLKTLGTIIRDEGLKDKIISYVKIDIEYSEWEVLKSIYQEMSLHNVRQFGFEMHSRELFHASKIDMPTTKEDFVQMYNLLTHNDSIWSAAWGRSDQDSLGAETIVTGSVDDLVKIWRWGMRG